MRLLVAVDTFTTLNIVLNAIEARMTKGHLPVERSERVCLLFPDST
jgi:hypothetical protein